MHVLLRNFGERLRNTIYGWPDEAFDIVYRRRQVMGFTVHLAFDPDMIADMKLIEQRFEREVEERTEG